MGSRSKTGRAATAPGVAGQNHDCAVADDNQRRHRRSRYREGDRGDHEKLIGHDKGSEPCDLPADILDAGNATRIRECRYDGGIRCNRARWKWLTRVRPPTAPKIFR